MTDETSVAEQSQPEERLLRQSEVNDIVREAKRHAAEKARQEALKELAPQPVQSLGGMQQMTPEEIRKLIAEESARSLQNQAQAMQLQRLATDFSSKIAASKDKYPELEAELNGMDLGRIAAIIDFANQMDNTADVMNDLIENRHKIANVMQLVSLNDLSGARKEIQKLSNSIKANEEAKNLPKPPDPLSQVKPSPIGSDGGGLQSVKDFRSLLRA